MDAVLIFLISIFVGVFCWIGNGISNYLGISNKGKFKMKLKESFTSFSFDFFTETFPLILFFLVVVLIVTNLPFYLIIMAINLKHPLGDNTIMWSFIIFDSIIIMISIVFLILTDRKT